MLSIKCLVQTNKAVLQEKNNREEKKNYFLFARNSEINLSSKALEKVPQRNLQEFVFPGIFVGNEN